MKYLLDEEELLGFLCFIRNDKASIDEQEDVLVKNFLKSQKPVEVIAEGEIWMDKDGIDELLCELDGKKGKLTFIEDKE